MSAETGVLMEIARGQAWRASEQCARLMAYPSHDQLDNEEAWQLCACTRCKAPAGTKCRWRIAHYDESHAPRIHASWRLPSVRARKVAYRTFRDQMFAEFDAAYAVQA